MDATAAKLIQIISPGKPLNNYCTFQQIMLFILRRSDLQCITAHIRMCETYHNEPTGVSGQLIIWLNYAWTARP